MAVAHYGTTADNSQSITSAGGALTFAHDSGSGSNRLINVWVAMINGNAHTIDSATYNGISLTALGATVVLSSCELRGFSLVAPATGSNTVSVSFSTGAGSDSVVMAANTYTGVDQATPYENYNTATVSDAAAPFVNTVTITSTADDHVVAACAARQNVTWTAGSGQTERMDAARTTDGNISLTVSDEVGAASVVMDHEASGLIQSCTMGISMIATASASVAPLAVHHLNQMRQ